MGDLIRLPGTGSASARSLAEIRRAAGSPDEQFRAALARELGWPGMSGAVLRALEEGRPEPTLDVMAAAERVLVTLGHDQVMPRSTLVPARLEVAWSSAGAADLDLERAAWPGLDARQLEDYQAFLRLCARQRRTMSLDVLVPAMEVTYSRLRGLVLDGPHSASRPAQVVAAEAGLLAGRLYYFAGRRGDASRALTFADAVARYTGADHILATVQVAMSYLKQASARQETLNLLTLAASLSGQHPVVHAWILARRAEEHAALHEETAALRDLDRAASALSKVADDALVSGPRTTEDLEGFRGSVLMHLGHPESASVLERSLDRLPGHLLARRAHTLTDLGAVRAQRGDVDAACAALTEAVKGSTRAGRVAYLARAAAVRRRHLSRWHGHTAVDALDEQLRLAGAPRVAVADVEAGTGSIPPPKTGDQS
jgi:hypothetical protein